MCACLRWSSAGKRWRKRKTRERLKSGNNGCYKYRQTGANWIIWQMSDKAQRHRGEIERIVWRREYKEDKETPLAGTEGMRRRLARELKTWQNKSAEGAVSRRARISALHCRVLSTVVNQPVGPRKGNPVAVAFAISWHLSYGRFFFLEVLLSVPVDSL